MKKTFFTGILLCLSTALAFAQPEGKPDLKRDKDLYKKAKKEADPKASLRLAQLSIGWLYTKDDYRSFLEAENWLKQVHGKLKPGESGELEAFKIYFTGGYGVAQDLSKAEKWAEKAKDNPAAVVKSAYNEDFHLAQAVATYRAAEKMQPHAMVQLAQYFLEFGMSYQKGMEWLDKAEELGSLDATFIQQRWHLTKRLALKGKLKSLKEKDINEMYATLAKRYANDGSRMAALEYAYRLVKYKMYHGRKLPVSALQERLSPLLNEATSPSDDLRLKALLLLAPHFEGRHQLMAYRQIEELRQKLELPVDSKRFKAIFTKAKAAKEGMQDVRSLAQLVEAYPNIAEQMQIIPVDFLTGYHGDFEALSQLYERINTGENKAFLGKKKLEKLNTEILQKFQETFQQSDDILILAQLEQALRNSKRTPAAFKAYLPKVEAQLKALEAKSGNARLFQEKKKIAARTFKTIPEGRSLLASLNGIDGLTDEATKELRIFACQKVVCDVYGICPMPETLTQLDADMKNNPWINPEGEEVFWEIKHNSPNTFSVKTWQGGRFFHVVAERQNEEKYKINILEVSGEAESSKVSNVVYSTEAKVVAGTSERLEVKIWQSKHKGYTWEVIPENYLKVSYPKEGDYFVAEGYGGLESAMPNKKLKKEGKQGLSLDQTLKESLRLFVEKNYQSF